jgi:flavin reductase (DIM6/NTAB) family NADH-FMN oxidoreductase RutF
MTDTLVADPADLAQSFKLAMRRLATTVSIVTALDADGRPAGMTATAVTSVCAEPPAFLVCVNKTASIHPSLALGAAMCLNLLAADHGDLSFAFGGKVPPELRFEQGDWQTQHSPIPYLGDAQANLFCTVDALLPYGTHSIVVGKVDAIRLHGDARPLIFGDGRFLPLL